MPAPVTRPERAVHHFGVVSEAFGNGAESVGLLDCAVGWQLGEP